MMRGIWVALVLLVTTVGFGTMAMLAASSAVYMAGLATAQAVIADITGPEDRAKGMGIIGAAFGLGFILGPAISALLAR